VASGSLLLVSGRYKPVEVGSTLMVAMFTLSTIVAMVALQWLALHRDEVRKRWP